MAVTSTIYVYAILLLLQNVSCGFIDPSYDCVAPWARTFLAWREANTNVAGGRLPPLFPIRNIPRLYSSLVRDDIPLPGAYFSALKPSAGGLAVTSVSKGPIGVSVLSENIIEGPLAVGGDLPFLGSVAVGGALPTIGSGSVSYGSDGANDALLAAQSGLLGFNRIVSLMNNKFGRIGYC